MSFCTSTASIGPALSRVDRGQLVRHEGARSVAVVSLEHHGITCPAHVHYLGADHRELIATALFHNCLDHSLEVTPSQMPHLGDGSRSHDRPQTSQDSRMRLAGSGPGQSIVLSAGGTTHLDVHVTDRTHRSGLPESVLHSTEDGMFRKILKFAFFTSFVYGFGMLARQLFLGLGDETTGEFELVTIMEGKRFVGRAEDLWSGKVTTVMGGVELDLRDAVLSPGGADLAVFTVMGGVAMRVPDTWIVELGGRAIAGGHDCSRGRPTRARQTMPRCCGFMPGPTSVASTSRPSRSNPEHLPPATVRLSWPRFWWRRGPIR